MTFFCFGVLQQWTQMIEANMIYLFGHLAPTVCCHSTSFPCGKSWSPVAGCASQRSCCHAERSQSAKSGPPKSGDASEDPTTLRVRQKTAAFQQRDAFVGWMCWGLNSHCFRMVGMVINPSKRKSHGCVSKTLGGQNFYAISTAWFLGFFFKSIFCDTAPKTTTLHICIEKSVLFLGRSTGRFQHSHGIIWCLRCAQLALNAERLGLSWQTFRRSLKWATRRQTGQTLDLGIMGAGLDVGWVFEDTQIQLTLKSVVEERSAIFCQKPHFQDLREWINRYIIII